LLVASAVALVLANSSFADGYFSLVEAEIGPELPGRNPMTAHMLVNDGLMAIFFLFVGLEIKREFLDGRLASWRRRLLPIAAASAGMILPAIIYLVVTAGAPQVASGWAIPAATDIAFAIGVLALLGPRAPASLKLFLVTVAIIDDMGAVAIIALAYTQSIAITALLAAALILGAMFAINRAGVRRLWLYLFLAVALWVAVLSSGVHATVAGVLAALAIPLVKTPGTPDSTASPLHRLEHRLDGWVAFVIVPLFGFFNAGITLLGVRAADLLAPIPLGIAAGLVIGKQLGIFGAVWLMVRSGLAERPRGSSWLQIYGLALLCGIGFTMSLFIGELAFPGTGAADIANREAAKLGILLGSLVSALAGYMVLRFAPYPRRDDPILGKDHPARQQGLAQPTQEHGS